MMSGIGHVFFLCLPYFNYFEYTKGRSGVTNLFLEGGGTKEGILERQNYLQKIARPSINKDIKNRKIMRGTR